MFVEKKWFELCLVLLVHWTWLDGDTCPKMDMCHNLNGSSAIGH